MKHRIIVDFEVVDGVVLAALGAEGGKKVATIRLDAPEALKLLAACTPTKLDDRIVPAIDLFKSQLDLEKKTKILSES